MRITIIDADTGKELWTTERCAEYIGVNRGTWRQYRTDGRIPEPAANMRRNLPLWYADDVKRWHAQRPSTLKGTPGRR